MPRLRILDHNEINTLYKIPKFNHEEQVTFFTLTDEDVSYLKELDSNTLAKIDYILQLGYFRAAQYFFPISFFKLREDVCFIIVHYFPQTSYPKANVNKRFYYKNQKKIKEVFNIKPTTKNFLSNLTKHGKELSKRDIRAKSIFYELLHYCQKATVMRPSYSAIQKIIILIVKSEKKRLHNKLKALLDRITKKYLDALLTIDDVFYTLTLLKKDPKDFSTNEMRKELKKQEYIAIIFERAKTIITKLETSRQNIQYYASLAEYYEVNKLKSMMKFSRYLYLLCFVWQRFNTINDHLVTYFIYKINYYIKQAQQYAVEEIYQAKLEYDEDRVKAGKVLKLIPDKKIEDKELRNKAFEIVPEKDFEKLVNSLIKPNFDKIFFHWQYYSKNKHRLKTNLRPVFKVLKFDCKKKEKLLEAIVFLLEHFKGKTKFKDYPKESIPMEFFSKKLKHYLIKKG